MICNNLYVIAAICGNFWRESTVNPGVWENLTVGDPGYGLGQWTDVPPSLTRRTQLFNWLGAMGYAQDSGEGQLQYLVHEAYWTPNSAGHTSAYNTFADFLASQSNNVADLTLEYMYHWEGINDPQSSTRIQYAQDYLALFQNDPGTRDPWYSGNFYNSVAHAENNALLIMDWFLTATPTPAPEPTPPDPSSPTEDDIKTFLLLASKRKMKGGYKIV